MNIIGIWVGGFGFNLETWSTISSRQADTKEFKLSKRIYHRYFMFSIGREGRVKQFKWEIRKIVNLG